MLERHIIRRIGSSTLLILTLVTVALTMMQFVRLGPLFLGPWVRLSDSICLVAVIPIVTLCLPVAMALATAGVAASMSIRGERRALAASGISPRRLLRAPLILMVLGASLTTLLSVYATPWSFAKLESGIASLATRAALASMPEGRFVDLPGGYVLYARSRSTEGTSPTLDDVLMSRTDEDGSEMTVSAHSATIDHHGDGRCTFSFEGATLITRTPGGDEVTLEANQVDVPVDIARIISSRRDTLPEILGRPTLSIDPAGTIVERYHLHRRVSVAVAAIALLTLASLAFVASTLRRPWSAPSLTAGGLVLYHGLVRGGEEMSLKGWVGPELGAWLPSVIILLLAGGVLAFVSRRP